MSKHFADRLLKEITDKEAPICVGLDPRLERIPKFLVEAVMSEMTDKSPMRMAATVILEFNKAIIDAVCDLVPAVKPQIAFYEIYGADGFWAYAETIKYAKRKGLLVIADSKRNDIGSTAEAYAKSFLGEITMFEGSDREVVMPVFGADSVTITPYLGWDGVKPFVEEADKYDGGVFALVKTSNQTGGDLQDLEMSDGNRVYEIMASYVDSWGSDYVGESGYSLLGAVVGATYPSEAKKLRQLMPQSIFLVPGYGAQGGGAEDVLPCFNKDGKGAIVNSSRGIIFAYEKGDFSEPAFAEAARVATMEMKAALKAVL